MVKKGGETAQRDPYGIPALLGNGARGAIRINATDGGNLCVTDSKKLLQVIKLPLNTARTMVQLAEVAYQEISVMVLDAPIELNFVDAEDQSKTVSIVRPVSITTAADRLWLSNAAAKRGSQLEIWLWG